MKKRFDKDILKSTLAANPSLSSVPKITVPIITMFNDPNTSFHDLAEVIESDPDLSARVLKITNSGFYGFKHRIESVSHAVVLLGWNAIKMITLGSTIISKMSEINKRLFEHSKRTAITARFLATEANFYKVEEIAVVGLLHDIGIYILETYFPENYMKIKQHIIDYEVPTYIAEREIIGVDHGKIGGWTLEEWDLPKNITDSVMWHHDFKAKKYHSRKTAVIHVADVLAIAADFTGPHWEKVPEINLSAIKTLGFTETEFRDIVLAMLKMKLDPLII